MSKVTADTITHEQIRELRTALVLGRPPFVESTPSKLKAQIGLCQLALGAMGTNLVVRAAARARCAEIWNARHTSDGGGEIQFGAKVEGR